MSGGPAPYNKRKRADRAHYAGIVFDLSLQGLSARKIEEVTRDLNGPTDGHRIPATTAKEMIREEAARRIDPKVDEWRAVQVARIEAALARLDGLEEAAIRVLEREHITVNNGRIIVLNDLPLPDDGPVLAAIDRLVKIEDARLKNADALCRMLGLNAPTKVEATVTETTQQDIELQELVAEMRAKNTNVADGLRAKREQGE
jgi:hypothetical protein